MTVFAKNKRDVSHIDEKGNDIIEAYISKHC